MYNWANKGRRNYSNELIKLKTKSTAGMKYTTKAWVVQFLEAVEE